MRFVPPQFGVPRRAMVDAVMVWIAMMTAPAALATPLHDDHRRGESGVHGLRHRHRNVRGLLHGKGGVRRLGGYCRRRRDLHGLQRRAQLRDFALEVLDPAQSVSLLRDDALVLGPWNFVLPGARLD